MSKTIMVVDDEPDIVLMVRLILELDGYDVLEAGTAEDAFEVLEREHPDALLLDIRLPGLDGWAVLDHLKASSRLPQLPVIMISAHSTPSTSARALDEGCSGYLTKPFDSEQLLSELNRVAQSDN
ncbi:MAG: response regulator [Actinomycetota bacterium]